MVYQLKDIESNCMTEINGKWVPVRPINYKYRTLKEKILEAWNVFIGRADAFMWPEGQ